MRNMQVLGYEMQKCNCGEMNKSEDKTIGLSSDPEESKEPTRVDEQQNWKAQEGLQIY